MYLSQLHFKMFPRNTILLLNALAFVSAEILVTIPDGIIRGRIEYSLRNISFYAFQEIPYAKPPVGELRFQEPQPAEPWEGILNATENTKICYQQVNRLGVNITLLENEDCLYLNVYTPRYQTSDASLPVLFYIHGGGHNTGSGNFDFKGPHYLMEHDVIVVSMNYRLGPYGYLATGDRVIPGNFALKDQLLALKWVNRNIEHFGGDPEKVTMFGASAGGACASLLSISSQAKGLFRAVILESGTTLAGWNYQKDHKKIAFDLASYIDSDFPKNATSEELLRFLRNASASDINKAVQEFPDEYLADQYSFINGVLFTPTVEPQSDGAILSDLMYGAVEMGLSSRVPILMGITSEEEIHRADNLTEVLLQAQEMDRNPSMLVNNNMHLTDPEQLQAVGEEIHKIYTEGKFVDNLGLAIRLWSENGFNMGNIRYAELQSKFSDIYFYQFSYYGPMSGYREYLEGASRVSHEDDSKYLLVTGNNSNLNDQTPSDRLASIRFTTLLTNFVKYLNPTPEPSSLFDNITWPILKPDNLVYLDINETLTIRKNPKGDVYSSWVNLYEKYAIKPYTTF